MKSDLDRYKMYIESQMDCISKMIHKYVNGDFSDKIECTDDSSEFSELISGLNTLVKNMQMWKHARIRQCERELDTLKFITRNILTNRIP